MLREVYSRSLVAPPVGLELASAISKIYIKRLNSLKLRVFRVT